MVGVGAAGTGKGAAEDFDDERQAVPLVPLAQPAEGQYGAARRGVQIVGVGGRYTLVVDQPAHRHRLSLVALHPHLALGRHAGGDVQHDRPALRGRNTHRDRIGDHAALGAAERGDNGAGAVSVHRGDADHAAFGGHGGIFAQAPDVVAVVNPHRAHRLFAGLVHGHFHGLRCRRLAVAPIGVQHHRRRRFLYHLQGRIRHAVAALHVRQVLRDADDAVGVVPHQIGCHQIAADQSRFLLRGAGALENSFRRCF